MKEEDKAGLRMRAGDLSGLYGIRPVCFDSGRARGVRAIELYTDHALACTLLSDRCLDLAVMRFRGVNIGLATKVGISSPVYYVEDGLRGFLRQFQAGMLTTCGIRSSGAPGTVDGVSHGLHGNISNTPAENVCVSEQTENGEVVLCVSGDMREACVFGEFLVLHREIRLNTESNLLSITDTIENRGFEVQPLMNLYHINFGYPMADEGTCCFSSMKRMEARDADACIERYMKMEPPVVGKPEECFIHTGGSGMQFGVVYNPKLGMAGIVHFDADALPLLCQWKCCHAGDYALAFEPSVAGFWGLEHAKKQPYMRYLQPGEQCKLRFGIELTDDLEIIRGYARKCKDAPSIP
jgi:hypothetical protein